MSAKGSCRCKAVAYQVELPFERFMYCHCTRCRKATGAAHAANGFVKPEAFRWTQGESEVRARGGVVSVRGDGGAGTSVRGRPTRSVAKDAGAGCGRAGGGVAGTSGASGTAGTGSGGSTGGKAGSGGSSGTGGTGTTVDGGGTRDAVADGDASPGVGPSCSI